jgi:hypothetical protein
MPIGRLQRPIRSRRNLPCRSRRPMRRLASSSRLPSRPCRSRSRRTLRSQVARRRRRRPFRLLRRPSNWNAPTLESARERRRSGNTWARESRLEQRGFSQTPPLECSTTPLGCFSFQCIERSPVGVSIRSFFSFAFDRMSNGPVQPLLRAFSNNPRRVVDVQFAD